MLWVYDYYKYFNSFSAVFNYRCHILRYKDGPALKRLTICIVNKNNLIVSTIKRKNKGKMRINLCTNVMVF